jgi:hypothetical protein
MIIWIASYPKSGNTWLRTILIQLLNKKEVDHDGILSEIKNLISYPQKKHFYNLSKLLDNYKIFDDYINKPKSEISEIRNNVIKNWINSQQRINIINKIKFFKTHNFACKLKLLNGENYAFTDLENTLGVIYIVRDPRNVVTSIKHHYSMNNYEEAINFMKNKSVWLQDNNKVPEMLSSWDNHYQSWSRFPKNFLLIRYEDLINNPYDEIKKIILYLKKFFTIEPGDDKIKKIIFNSSFKNLKKDEEKNGFEESVKDKMTGVKKKFFYLGPKNNWENILEDEIANEIEKNFEVSMKKLGYLN